MMKASTDQLVSDEARGETRVLYLTPLETVSIEQPEDRIVVLLKKASRERLINALIDQINKRQFDTALKVSQELTNRGIAPRFRQLNEHTSKWEGDTEAEFILLVGDLQWVASRYPKHKPEWKRAEGIFNPRTLIATAKYLYWEGYRTAGQLSKALALTEQQQNECAWVQCLHVRRWNYKLQKRLVIAKELITKAVRIKDKRPREEQNVTIKRRIDLWLSAELGEWKPQATANFYAMMTGEKLPRNLVAKQLEKLPKVRRTDTLLPQ